MSKKNSKTALYKVIWRWHFYAGIFCIPFIILLSISGAIYLFKPQIESWIEQPYQQLQVSVERTTPNQQIKASLQALSGAQFHYYRLPRTATDAVVISVIRSAEQYLVYINPYTLDILNIVPKDKQFMALVRHFHGELLAGTLGAILVELAACWAIVLIITGLYLWWPTSGHGFAGVLYPRLSLQGRWFWKELHAVIGMWVALFTLFFLISALPWALVWGSALKEIRTLGEQTEQQNWNINNKKDSHHWGGKAVARYNLTPQLLSRAQSLGFLPPVELSISDEVNNIWKLSSMTQNRPLRADAWLDGDSATVLKYKPFAERKLLDRVIGVGIAVHEGQLFGWLNQLLGLLTAAGLVVISVSGFILWRKRKPHNKLGAPSSAAHQATQRFIAMVIILIALLLPVLLASLILLFFIEYFLLRKIPRLQKWLGLEAT